MRILALLLLAALLLPPIWLREPVPVAPPGILLAAPLPSDLPPVVDGFTREALWQIDSPSFGFGGYSAMLVPGEGRLQLFSDRGLWLALATADGRIGRPAGRRPFPRVRDIGAFSERHPDIESATRDPVTGQYWLGFESFNAIARYSSTGALQAVQQPPEMRNWPINSGIEAMARLADGRFIVLPEHRGPGLLFAADPSAGNPAIAFRFDLPDPYYATDLAQLPDGRVLVLARGLRAGLPPFTARLYLGDPARIAADGYWPLEQVLELDRLVPRENWEALGVEDAGAGDVVLWLASDDNRAALQRTLLARLRWRLPPVPDSATRPEA